MLLPEMRSGVRDDILVGHGSEFISFSGLTHDQASWARMT